MMQPEYAVDSADDNTAIDGHLTLREPFMAANSDQTAATDPDVLGHATFSPLDSGRDLINFAIPVGSTIQLTMGPLSVTDNVSIDGPDGSIVIDGGGQRAFVINAPGTSDITLGMSKLWLKNGGIENHETL